MTKNKNLLFIILFLAIGFGFYFLNKKCEKINCLNFDQRSEYDLQEVFIEKEDVFLGLYKNNDRQLRVEIVNNDDFEEVASLLKSRIARVEAQFANDISPYPGEISDEIECNKSFQPKIEIDDNEDGFKNYKFKTYLNSRLVSGSCQEDDVEYIDYSSFFYCSNQKKIYFLEFIIEKNNTDFVFPKIDCL